MTCDMPRVVGPKGHTVWVGGWVGTETPASQGGVPVQVGECDGVKTGRTRLNEC